MEIDNNKMLLKYIGDDSRSFTLDDRTPFILGRSRETQIRDTRCSRTQLILTPDYETGEVLIEQLGDNPSAINGNPLRKGTKRKAKHNDIIEVLQFSHYFKIDYKRADVETPSQSTQFAIRNTDTEKLIQSEMPKMNTEKPVQPEIQQVDVNRKQTGSLDHFLKDSVLKPEGSWKSISENSAIIFISDGIECRDKIAAFDLDGTVITTLSGNVYPKDHNDWKLAFPSTKDKLIELHNSNFKLVFFTNQGGIGRGKIKISDFKNKIEAIVRKLHVPVQIFISTMDDMNRKPRPGMWNLLVKNENDGVQIDYEKSFYCGDAAGRPANCEPNKRKRDFSLSDRLFAMNVKLKFHTPEEFFLGWKPAPFDLPKFNPNTLSLSENLFNPATTEFPSKQQEIIIMVGCPGSGKSFFSKTYAVPAGYVYVNRDTLRTWQKCVTLAEKGVKDKLSVIIDNTSPDKESRARYTKIAKDYNISVRAFWMETTLEHAQHNNTFRQILKEDSHGYIPNHSINQFINILEEPTLDEGFREIVRVKFIPKFKDYEQKKLYNMHLLESKH